jgi:hypothetical protein
MCWSHVASCSNTRRTPPKEESRPHVVPSCLGSTECCCTASSVSLFTMEHQILGADFSRRPDSYLRKCGDTGRVVTRSDPRAAFPGGRSTTPRPRLRPMGGRSRSGDRGLGLQA